MSLTSSKWVTLSYIGFCLVVSFLFDIGKISKIPISLGMTAFMLFFIWKAVMGFFSEQDTNKLRLLIYWGIVMQLSIQSSLLFQHAFRYEIVSVAFLVFFAVLFLIYRYKKEKHLVLLSVSISMLTCGFYFQF